MLAICRMSESPFPSQNQDKFIVRLPDGMRDRIKAAAEAANRSMNAEIVMTLEEKYPAPPEFSDEVRSVEIYAEVFKLMKRISQATSDEERKELLQRHVHLSGEMAELAKRNEAVRQLFNLE